MPLANINQYRKATGIYNNQVRPLSKKARVKLAKQSSNRIRTHQSSRPQARSHLGAAAKLLLTAAIISVAVTSAEALENGQRVTDPKVQDAFPLLQLTITATKRTSWCSSVKVGPRELITAKHCFDSDKREAHIQKNGRQIKPIQQIDSPNFDMTILKFDEDISATTNACLPIMTEGNRTALESAPPDVCGLGGQLIILGRGKTSEKDSVKDKKLKSGVFKLDKITSEDYLQYTQKSASLGVAFEGLQPCTWDGDSGAAVAGCNTATGAYELVGIHTSSSRGNDCNKRASNMVDVKYSEVAAFIRDNTNPSTCAGTLKPNELISTTKHELKKPKSTASPTKKNTTTTTTTSNTSDSEAKQGKSEVGMIAGVSVAAVAVIGLGTALAAMRLRKSRDMSNSNVEATAHEEELTELNHQQAETA